MRPFSHLHGNNLTSPPLSQSGAFVCAIQYVRNTGFSHRKVQNQCQHHNCRGVSARIRVKHHNCLEWVLESMPNTTIAVGWALESVPNITIVVGGPRISAKFNNCRGVVPNTTSVARISAKHHKCRDVSARISVKHHNSREVSARISAKHNNSREVSATTSKLYWINKPCCRFFVLHILYYVLWRKIMQKRKLYWINKPC